MIFPERRMFYLLPHKFLLCITTFKMPVVYSDNPALALNL